MSSFEEIRQNRIRKLETLIKEGVNPYPIDSVQDYTLSEVAEDFIKLSKIKKPIHLVGRIMSIRGQGAISFITLNDGTEKFQGVLKKDDVDPKTLQLFRDTVDIGDFIQVSGSLYKTQRKEKSILIKEWRMLSKGLRPLPEKWHGLQDVEEKVRRRYLDTLMDDESRERFITRSRIITEFRNVLDKADYLEVETPMLQPLAGGASARPFITHHNALDIDLNLRIAPELYLKKLLVGGFPKVYEINRNFRNEGIGPNHNPEFTMLEFYESFGSADSQMRFVEKIMKTVVKKVYGKSVIEFDKEKIDFSKKFNVVKFLDLLKTHALITDPEKMSKEELATTARQFGVSVKESDAPDKIMDNIYKKVVRPKLIQPTFIVDYPVAFSPFAKRKEDNPELIELFQLVVGGIEMVKAFSELNDPLDQRKRYLEQDKKRKEGESEVSPSDEDYLEAMEYGMPPAGGVGIGIDRFVMLLTNTKNIRDVILFPTMRPRD